MLAETSGLDLESIRGAYFTEYAVSKLPGWSARVVLLITILMRPICLASTFYFAKRFNALLRVDRIQLIEGLAAIAPGDSVLWFNPSLAIQDVIEGLRDRDLNVHMYFVDPVHRLGLSSTLVRSWSSWAGMATYSKIEAARLGIKFLVPYAPAIAPSGQHANLDIVYIGSPSPKRLVWVLYLQALLRMKGSCGYLRLATRNQRLVGWFPSVFSDRISFSQYAQLCSRSRSILELHELDAEGVTLRATLCQSLGLVHICNLATTAQTLTLSLGNVTALNRFLRQRDGTPMIDHAVAPVLDSPHLDVWLERHFG
jgi:hypothetical protein